MEYSMKHQRLYLNLIFAFLVVTFSADFFCQEQLPDIDDIQNLSYEEIQEMEWQAFENDEWEKLRQILQVHVKKARIENNDIEVGRAFYFRTIIEESEKGLMYCDSIIQVTLNSKHPNYPTLGYTLKAHIYYKAGNFKPALENYLLAYNLALKKENKADQREISLAIAALRNINGQHYTAADFYRRSLELLQKEKDFQKIHYREYITLLYNLSLTHLRLSEIDSARYYAKSGIENMFQSNDKIKKDELNLKDFVLLDAQINYHNKDYDRAKDTLLKYVDSLQGTSKAIKFYYLGKIQEESGNAQLAKNYYKSVDSIVSKTGDPFNEVKEVYQKLIMYSIVENNQHKQIEYMGKLIHIDSVLSSEQENVIHMAMADYDIPFLKHQKKKVEEQLKTKSKYIKVMGILAGITLLSGINFFVRARKTSSRLKILLEEGPNRLNNPKKILEHPISVPEDVREDILSKLEAFENSDRYLDKELDMSILAQEFETNTTYLSTVINHYKQMSFPNYLKDLKIATAIERLSEDAQLLKYNYQGLAETFGFKTAESFSKAFYNKTGVNPSKFLDGLKSRRIARHL